MAAFTHQPKRFMQGRVAGQFEDGTGHGVRRCRLGEHQRVSHVHDAPYAGTSAGGLHQQHARVPLAHHGSLNITDGCRGGSRRRGATPVKQVCDRQAFKVDCACQ